MKSQILYTVRCNISGEAAPGEICNSSPLEVEGLIKEKPGPLVWFSTWQCRRFGSKLAG